jgi:hypothetical protein
MAGGGSMQLNNLADDLGETMNLAEQNPNVVADMTAMLARIRAAGRSR